MTRFLTPAKIGLLALIELYVEGQVPNDAILPVLSFIAFHIMDHDPKRPTMDKQARWAKAEKTVSLVIGIKDFEKLLGSYPFLMGMPGRKLWDQFLEKLWDMNSLDAMNEFFERLPDMLAKSREERRRLAELHEPEEDNKAMKLARISPLGAFVRRAEAEYLRLRFHDCTDLWKSFVRYRQPTVPYIKRKNPGISRLSFDNVLLLGEQEDWDAENVVELATIAYGDMLSGNEPATVPVSMDDIETLLEFQIDQMQKYGSRIPHEIRHLWHDLLADSYVTPSLNHYLTFLEAWRGGDYPTAFDTLHRYFDYTMQHRDRLFYQYALMNLAVLQADFGCNQEAVSAMLESVSAAKENRDMVCLNFALNWLFHFGRAHPDLVQDLESKSLLKTGRESLAFLRVKARETGMWTLWSSVLLSEAKLGLIGGESIATGIEFLVRSSHIIVERNMQNMFGSQLSMQSALWDRLGLAQPSLMTSEMFLRCHARNAVFDDELKFVCRIAYNLAATGKYDEGLEMLDGLDQNSLRAWKQGQYCNKYRGLIKLKRDLHHNHLDGAEQLLSQMLQGKVDDIEPDIGFLIDTMHVDCLTRRGDFQAAFAKVEEMLAKVREDKKDIFLKVKLLVLKAHLLNAVGRPQRGFTIAMRAAKIAWGSRLIPCLWQATGSISNILVSLGEFDAASNLLTAVIPRSMECEAPAITGQLYSYLGDANMGLAGKMEPESSKRTEYLTKASLAIQKAFDYYSSVEDINQQCQLMAKKAMIMKLSGDMTMAADYAASYSNLKNQAEALKLA